MTNLDARIDYARFNNKVLSMLLASAAARATAERSPGFAVAGLLFWAVVWFACSVLRARLRKQEDSARTVQLVANTIAALGLLLFLMRLLDGSILPALLVLLAGAEAALIVMAEKRSHLWLMIGGALAMVFFAAAESRSALFVICLAWYTLAALDLLAADHAVERESGVACARLDSAPSAGGFTFAAISLCLALPLYLFIPKPEALATGQMEARSAHDYSDPGRGDQGDRSARVESGEEGEQRRSRVGSDDPGRRIDTHSEDSDVDLRHAGFDRTRANQIVMFVRSSSPVYLRGSLYDYFEDGRWARTAGTPTRRYLDQGGGLDVSDSQSRGELVTQTIEVVADIDRADIYAAPGIRRLRFPGPVLYAYPDGTYEAPQPLRSDTTYSVESRLGALKGRYLVADTANKAASVYLRLPDRLSSQITALATQVAGSERGEIAKALALESYLRSHYESTLDTRVAYQGDTPLDWFLFESKRGHCEFFASALAVMLRTQGVATRVARGFSLGERNPITGFYEVRVLDGHEWVEAFIPGHGWLMLEPTPLYPLPRSNRDVSVAEQTDSYLQRLAQTTRQIEPGSVRDLLLGALNDSWSTLRHLQRQALSRLSSLGWWLLVIPGALLVVYLAALLARRWYQDLEANARIRGLLQGLASDQREAVLRAAEALTRMSAPRSLERGGGATFRDYYGALLPHYPGLLPAFADLFDDACYGNGWPMGPPGSPAADPGALGSVAAVIAMELEREPYPRVRRELRLWGDVLRDAYSRLHPRRLTGAAQAGATL